MAIEIILAVVALADAALKAGTVLGEKISRLRRIPKEIAELQNVLSYHQVRLQIVVKTLEHLEAAPINTQLNIADTISRLRLQITNATDILKEANCILNIIVPKSKIKKAFGWSKTREQAEGLTGKLKLSYETIGETLVNIKTQGDIQSQYLLQEIHTAVVVRAESSPTRSMPASPALPASSSGTFLSSSSTVVNYNGGPNTNSLDTNGNLAPDPSKLHPFSLQPDNLVLLKSYLATKDCQKNCPCLCHGSSHLFGRFLWIGSVLFSTRGFHYTGQKSCDYTRCVRQRQRAMKLTYIFPGWMVMKALTTSLVLGSLATVSTSFNIRVNNVVPLSSPIFNDIITGNVSGMLSAFSQKLASPLDVDPFGRSLLHWSFDQMQPEVSKALLLQGADPHLVDHRGRTPIEICWERILMNSDSNQATKQLRAICEGVEEFSVQKHMNFTELHMRAVGLSHIAMRDALEKNPHIDVNAQDALGRTPLFWAVSRGDVDGVRNLLTKGADPSIRDWRGGQTCLQAAASGGVLDRVQALLTAADIEVPFLDIHPGPPLSVIGSEAEPREEVMGLLLDYGANIDLTNKIHNNTALHSATHIGALAHVRFLVERGADLESQNVPGSTPLDVAIWEAHIDTFKHLLEAGASVSYRPKKNENILHSVARTRNVDIMRLLAEVDLRDVSLDLVSEHDGLTPIGAFYSFTSNISAFYNPPNQEQRDAWNALERSINARRLDHSGDEGPEILGAEDIEAVEAEDSGSDDGIFFDAED